MVYIFLNSYDPFGVDVPLNLDIPPPPFSTRKIATTISSMDVGRAIEK